MVLRNKVLYEFGSFRFDPADRLLLRDGHPIALSPKAMDILLVLVQNGRRLTTKEELLSRVWPDTFVEEANLTVNVSTLRKLLGETEDGLQFIETVPKSGYRFVAAVTELSEEQAPKREAEQKQDETPADLAPDATTIESAPLLAAAPSPGRASPKTVVQRSWLRFLPVALGVLVGTIVALVFLIRSDRIVPIGRSSEPRRLAILPFQNLRNDAADDFLGFSLADAVITKLGYVSSLVVRPSYSVQKYKSQPPAIPKVASELNVDTLLTGTFLREGDDLRIACQLVDVKTQNILWKGSFDMKYEKLLTVQDEVAGHVINGLALTLPPSEAARLKPDQPVNPAAYEYYLRGVDLYSKSDFSTAIKMLEKSAELAPNYALTWAHLGRTHTANASFQFGGAGEYQKAQAAFERALSLQPDQIDSSIYMANMFTDTGRVERAVPLLREALRTNPNHAETHWELGYAYRHAGMLPESVFESERARELDPGVKLTTSTLTSYLYLGQYQKFLDSLPESDDVALIAFYRGFGEYYQNRLDPATRDFDRAFELDPSLFHAQIGRALALAIRGQPRKGIGILRTVETKINERGVGDPEAIYKIAQAYAVLGDKSSASRVLKYSIENGFFPYPYFQTDPLLAALRQESQFAQLMDVARQRHEAFKRTFF
jgi:DNA-binding winged helix-turn-helix (wHTH) protein/TolB-like protein